jgi:hypothetical protein
LLGGRGGTVAEDEPGEMMPRYKSLIAPKTKDRRWSVWKEFILLAMRQGTTAALHNSRMKRLSLVFQQLRLL